MAVIGPFVKPNVFLEGGQNARKRFRSVIVKKSSLLDKLRYEKEQTGAPEGH